MGLLRGLGILLGILIIFGVGFYAYLGGFSPVSVTRGTYGPVEIIFTTYLGPYPEVGPAWSAFEAETEAAGLEACDALAVYLDPPDVPPEELRSILACAIDGLPEAQKDTLKSQFASFVLPQSDAYLARFPYKLTLSYMLGPMKVYPAIGRAMEEDGVIPPVGIEVYGPMDEIEDIGFVVPYGIELEAYQPLFDAFGP